MGKIYILFDGLFFISTLLYIAKYYEVANFIMLAGLFYYLCADVSKGSSGKGYKAFAIITAMLLITLIILTFTQSIAVNNDILNYKIIHKCAWLGIIFGQFTPGVYKAKKEVMSSGYCVIITVIMIVQYILMTYFFYIRPIVPY